MVPAARPLLCLVTDRRRLALRLDLPPDSPQLITALCDCAVTAARAGANLLQVREPDLPAARLREITRELKERLRGTATLVIVNDRLDVALAAGADGVHLKETSIDPRRARQLLPGSVLGASVHSVSGAERAIALGVDYLIAGTVFSSVSKPGAPTLGESGLRAIVDAAQPVPVLGIGGIGVRQASAIAAAGAAGMAGIEVFLPAHHGERRHAADLAAVIHQLIAAFDSARPVT